MASAFAYVGKALTSINDFYRDINPSTLSGAIDIVVVESDDGSLACSPFHIRFGKLKLLMPSEKIIEIFVNGTKLDIQMKLGDAGEAFFVVETLTEFPREYMTSPIPSQFIPSLLVEPLQLDTTSLSSQTQALISTTTNLTSLQINTAPAPFHTRRISENETYVSAHEFVPPLLQDHHEEDPSFAVVDQTELLAVLASVNQTVDMVEMCMI